MFTDCQNMTWLGTWCRYCFRLYLISWISFPGQTSPAPSGSLPERSVNKGTHRLYKGIMRKGLVVWRCPCWHLTTWQVKIQTAQDDFWAAKLVQRGAREACLVYNAVNFAFLHRLLDGLSGLYHGFGDLLRGTGCEGEDVILTWWRKDRS